MLQTHPKYDSIVYGGSSFWSSSSCVYYVEKHTLVRREADLLTKQWSLHTTVVQMAQFLLCHECPDPGPWAWHCDMSNIGKGRSIKYAYQESCTTVLLWCLKPLLFHIPLLASWWHLTNVMSHVSYILRIVCSKIDRRVYASLLRQRFMNWRTLWPFEKSHQKYVWHSCLTWHDTWFGDVTRQENAKVLQVIGYNWKKYVCNACSCDFSATLLQKLVIFSSFCIIFGRSHNAFWFLSKICELMRSSRCSKVEWKE